MTSWSDSGLSLLNAVLQWIAPVCMVFTLLAGILLIFVKTELGRRQSLQISRLSLETEMAKKDASVANAQAAQANAKTEAERLERIRLEASLAPRTVVWTGETREELSLFTGTRIRIEADANDKEAWTLAQQMVFGLGTAKWSVTLVPAPSAPSPGVTVDVKQVPDDPSQRKLMAAAKILTYHLKDNDIWTSCTVLPPQSGGFAAKVSDGSILMEIGAKPEYRSVMTAMQRHMSQGALDAMSDGIQIAQQVMAGNSQYDATDKARIIEEYKGSVKNDAGN